MIRKIVPPATGRHVVRCKGNDRIHDCITQMGVILQDLVDRLSGPQFAKDALDLRTTEGPGNRLLANKCRNHRGS